MTLFRLDCSDFEFAFDLLRGEGMRWFKHLATAANNEKLSRLCDAHGLAGYGFWWRLVEIVAASLDQSNKTWLCFSDRKWAGLVGISTRKFRTLAEFCAELGLFSLRSEAGETRIDIPNLVKFRDEYQRKNGRRAEDNPDALRSIETETEAETQADWRGDERAATQASPEPGLGPAGGPGALLEPEFICELPLRGRTGQPDRLFGVTSALFESWTEAYPLVDVRRELKGIKAWLLSNPARQPVSNMPRFVNMWLSRDHNAKAAQEARSRQRAGAEFLPASYAQCQDLERRQRALRIKNRMEAEKNGLPSNSQSGTGEDLPAPTTTTV